MYRYIPANGVVSGIRYLEKGIAITQHLSNPRPNASLLTFLSGHSSPPGCLVPCFHAGPAGSVLCFGTRNPLDVRRGAGSSPVAGGLAVVLTSPVSGCLAASRHPRHLLSIISALPAGLCRTDRVAPLP